MTRYHEWILNQLREDLVPLYVTCKACKQAHLAADSIQKEAHFGPANLTLYYCSQKCIEEDHLAWLAGRLNE